MLRSLSLEPVYDSSEHDIVQDLMVPCLAESTDYLRGVGFFSSGWLRLAAHGLVGLVGNRGRATFVVSPILQEDDWDAIRLGAVARDNPTIKAAIERSIRDLEESLQEETRNTLAWLVADGVLEFLIAVPRDRRSEGDYHDKVGLFADDQGDKVAFHGSFNDSIKGSLNGEAFSVFRSWDSGQAVYVAKHEQRLGDLVANRNTQFEVFMIPDAARESLIRLRTTAFRPYHLAKDTDNGCAMTDLGVPVCPYNLYAYQKQAIEGWMKNNCSGLWEMATGTGKTITSLAGATAAFSKKQRLALVVLVPYLHLLDQWEREARTFGYDPVLCSSAHDHWYPRASSRIDDFKSGATAHLTLIAVHATASSDAFQKLLCRLPKDCLLLVADEVHSLGAAKLRNALSPHADMRMGLSATPRRWFDEHGTQLLLSYFRGIVFAFGLEEAIGTYLTPYDYEPVLVTLTPAEMAEYQELSARIALAAKNAQDDDAEQTRLERLLLERARIIWAAENKLPAVMELLRRVIAEAERGQEPFGHLLVYCAPGEHAKVLRSVSSLGLRCHEFVHTVPLHARTRLLEAFGNGEIQVLVAMKCLDEGVDVPSTRTAIFMASTTNPREFIQRRGRVLRRAPGKTAAVIYDLIAVPPTDAGPWNDGGCSVLRHEMPRFAEFSSAARNQYAARRVVRDLLDQYGMLHLLDLRPWDIYRESGASSDLDPATKPEEVQLRSGGMDNGNNQ
ncbi:MAG: DEAD/DEAH box helicase family protein [Thermoguttaceae bacterium]|jgi:superfamily II DNA or RNA helicase